MAIVGVVANVGGRREIRWSSSDGKLSQPVAQTQHVRAPAGEELAPVAQIQVSAADNVRDERIAGDELAMGQSGCEGVKIGGVGRTGATLREFMLDRPHHPLPCFATRAVGLVGGC
jgi:hypothetical protein